MSFDIQFFDDVVRHHELRPCKLWRFVYPTQDEAEQIAKAEMPKVREKYGPASGYIVTDNQNHQLPVAIGGPDPDANY